MSETLVCDQRERDVIAALVAANVPHTVQSLQLGDFWLCVNDVPRICFERKTAADAEASIHDGRYHDQQARMRAWSGVTCAYIYETASTKTSKSVATVFRRGALFRGIPCLYTTSPDTTADLLVKTLQDLGANHGGSAGASLCIKSPLVKNSAVPTEKAFEVMLSVLPKIGRKTAAAIAQVYPTPAILCNAYAKIDAEKRAELIVKTVPKVSRPISAYLARVFAGKQ